MALLSGTPSLVTVPSSVNVPSGSSSAGFTATAGTAVTTGTPVMLTATLSGNSRNFSLDLTPATVTQPGVASVVCSPTTLKGGSIASCIVSLAASAPSGGTAVTLSSSNSYATAPAQVIVPAGLTNAGFIVTAATVSSTQASTISAGSAGVTQSTMLTIKPANRTASLAALTCTPGTVAPGASSTCTVSLTAAAPSGGTTVGLGSGNSSVSVPASVLVPFGSTSVNFNATAGPMSGTVSAVLTASLDSASATFSLAVTSQSALSLLSCNPAAVTAGGSSTCTVTLSSAAPSGGFSVTLSSGSGQVSVQGSVQVPAGSISANVTASVAANAASGNVTLSATAGSVARTATLTITAASGAASMICTPATVQTPGTSTCTFSLGSPAVANTQVTLNSSSASVTIPPSITIGTGLTSATFTAIVAAVPANATASLGAVGLNASQTLTLLPMAKTASIASISCSPRTLTGGGTSTCQIALSGAAPAGGASIELSSSSTQLSIPSMVQVAQGSTSAQFSATSSLIAHDEKAQLIANLGSSSAQAALALRGIKPAALTCLPTTLQSGLPLTCRVTLNSGQATTPIALTLASGNSHVILPASVPSQARQAAINFQAATTFVPVNQSAVLSVSFQGATLQNTVNLTPAPPVVKVPSKQVVSPGQLVTFPVSASDPAGLAVTLSVAGPPPGASFNPYTGIFEWVPQSSQAGLFTIHFTGTSLAMVSATEDVVVEVSSSTPVISSLANAASYAAGGCSPGSVASLLGTGFVKTGVKAVETSSPPNQVNGLHVTLNGESLPVFYAGESQVNFQCPQLAPGSPVSLVIQSDTGTSSPLTSTMEFASPGIYSLDGSGKGQGAILVSNSASIAMTHVDGTSSQPAVPGDFISIYATGLGPTNVVIPVGTPAPVKPLAEVTAPVDVLIDGQKADVTFAGLAPGFAGLYQVNAQLPATATIGEGVPVQIAVHRPDGTVATSNVVTIAIAMAGN